MKYNNTLKKIIVWLLLVIMIISNTLCSYAYSMSDFVFVDENDEITYQDNTEELKIQLCVALDNELESIDVTIDEFHSYEKKATPSNATPSNAEEGVFYISAKQLEKVLSDYGFISEEYNGEKYFPFLDGEYLTNDLIPVKDSGEWYIPVLEDTILFYCPKKEISEKTKIEDVLDENMFYSIKSDSLLTDGEDISDTFYVLNGNDITLSSADEIIMPLNINAYQTEESLICVGDNGTIVNEEKDEFGNSVFKITSIKQPYQIKNVEHSSVEIKQIEHSSFLYQMKLSQGLIKAASFVIDGTDYSGWTWYDENGAEIILNDYIGEIINSPIYFYSNGPKTKDYTAEGTINFYVSVNGQWIHTTETMKVNYLSTYGRYYLSAAQLESVYGKYGFDADMLKSGTKYFPHAEQGNTTIWADASAIDGYSPILSNTPDCDVWYMPYENISNSFNTSSWWNYTEFQEITEQNTHYEIIFNDPLEKTDYKIEEMFCLNGNSIEIEIPSHDRSNNLIEYEFSDSDIELSEPQDGIRILTINNITSTFTITVPVSENEYVITYDINNLEYVPHTGETPSINGKDTHSDILDFNTMDSYYTVKSPTRTSYAYKTDKYLYRVKFNGWKIDGTNNLIEAGRLYSKEEIKQIFETVSNNQLNLIGDWSVGTNPTSVHFYLNLSCQILNYDGSVNTTPTNQFTDAVYVTTISESGTEIANSGSSDWIQNGGEFLNSEYIVLQGASDGSAYEIDSQIRTLTTKSYNEINGYEFSLESFPSDDEVFREVRTLIDEGTEITITEGDGTERLVTSDEMTTDNFTIRWYVLKYSTSDAWHIDGILVAKQGQIAIQKTFLGEEQIIGHVKDDYSITIENENDKSDSRRLVLTDTNNNNEIKYDDYDKNTNTYTWNLPVSQVGTYTIKENNYEYQSNDPLIQIDTIATYSIKNSEEDDIPWTRYSDNGITGIKGEVYADDLPSTAYKTVMLRNSYTISGTLTINKLDSVTGNGIGGISFIIKNKNSDNYKLYEKDNGFYIFTDDVNEVPAGYTESELIDNDYVITTNENGSIFIIMGSGEYTLTEKYPTGYHGADIIDITVVYDGEGNPIFYSAALLNGEDVSDVYLKNETEINVLSIDNVSEVTSVKAEKVWNEYDTPEPVTFALYRNQTPVYDENGVAYTVTLDGTTDNYEVTPWEYTWTNLPLYVDGKIAKYSLRETKIGDLFYDPSADTDGYSNYVVEYNNPIYTFEDQSKSDQPIKNTTDRILFASEVLLTVRNSKYSGQVTFQKTDENGNGLAGALFYIYERTFDKETGETIDTVVSTGISDSNGIVTLNLTPGKHYIMKEIKAPDGYIISSEEYEFTVSGNGTIITTGDGVDTGGKIVNYKEDISLNLKKVSEDGVTNLQNAVFDLYKWNDENKQYEQLQTNLISDENGDVLIGKIAAGRYYIIETSAPEFYKLNNEKIYFTVSNGTIQLTDEAGNPFIVQDDYSGRHYKIEKEENDFVLTIINEKLEQILLPETGGPGIYVSLTGIVLMFFGILLLKQRRRYE